MADNKQKQNRDPLSAIDAAVNEKMNQWQQQRQLEELKDCLLYTSPSPRDA